MKRIVLIVGGILLAGLVTGLTCVALAATQTREVAHADDDGLFIPSVADEESRVNTQPWLSQQRRGAAGATGQIKTRRPATAGVSTDEETQARPVVKSENQLAKVLVPAVAGCMALGGLALLIRGLNNKPARHRREKIANTAILVSKAGARRRREYATPATVAFTLRTDKSQESQETKELRRAA